jgi:UDP:flavonoid glycosyltransferase YjiC (YdhE family)
LKKPQLTILVSPLDWGLGHASRMIPVISRFMQDGQRVIIAGSGRSARLLKHTFPGLLFLQLPAPAIRFATGRFSWAGLIMRFPALIWSVIQEHRRISTIVDEYRVDIVVSDNRYGLYCRHAYCVFVTHQLSPVLPGMLRFLEFPVYRLISHFISCFTECWIPDVEDTDHNISGKLSHRYNKPPNAEFIGTLSRFCDCDTDHGGESVNRFDLAVILSGPEPQISTFENKVIGQVQPMPITVIILKGLRDNIPIQSSASNTNITLVFHLETQAFSQVIRQAGQVLCRSGYSGIMDMVALGVPAILVPTPGQSEQEYLANYLSARGWFRTIRQNDMQLQEIIGRKGNPDPDAPRIPASVQSDFSFIKDLYHKYSQYRYKSKQKPGVNL